MGYTNTYDIRELAGYVKQIRGAMDRAHKLAMLETIEEAYRGAVVNARNNFIGRWGYVKTGALQNSIYRGYDKSDGSVFVGVRANKGRAQADGSDTRPYGRIHEFGGTIRPVKAKHLWQKMWDVPSGFKRMTPSEFITKKKQLPKLFFFIKGKTNGRTMAATNVDGKVVPLFLLRDSTVIPARPFVVPAVEGVFPDKYNSALQKWIANEMAKGSRA